MKLINNKYLLIEKKSDTLDFSFFLAKDIRIDQTYYLLLHLHNSSSLNIYNQYLDFIIETKKKSFPAIVNPIDIIQVNTIDDIKVYFNSFFILFPYEEKIPLEDFLINNKEKEIIIKDNINKLDLWLLKSGYPEYSSLSSIILIDNNFNPYYIPLIKTNKEQIETLNKNIDKTINYKPLLNNQVDESLDLELIYKYFTDYSPLYSLYFSLVDDIFKTQLNFWNEIESSPDFARKFIYNFLNFPSIFQSAMEDYLYLMNKEDGFNYLAVRASPDDNSLLFDIFNRIDENYKNEIELLNIRSDKIFEDITELKKSLIDGIILLSMNKPLVILINNINVADYESIKFLSLLANLKHLHYPIFFIIFNYKTNNELNWQSINIDFLLEKRIFENFKNLICELLKKLFLLNESDTEFLKNLELSRIIDLLHKKPNLFLIKSNSHFTIRKEKINKFLKNEYESIFQSIIENPDIKKIFFYFLFFEKPTPIKFLNEIFGKNIINLITKYIKIGLIFIDEQNKINSNQISTMRLIFRQLLTTNFDKKRIIEDISEIYLKYTNELNINEVFLLFKYLCELDKYDKAAELVDNKILLPLSSSLINIKKIFFNYLQTSFNFGKNFDKIKDIFAQSIFKLFYFKLKFINKEKNLENLLLELYETSKNTYFHFRFVIEKILYYIKIHNTEKIESDLLNLEKNYENLSDEIKKLFLYSKAEDFFSRYDHKNAISTSKQLIKILSENNSFDRSLYLPTMHRMVNSIIYSCSYEKANKYLHYYLKKALELKDIKFVFYAYNNLGVVNYRNKEFETARNFMINASAYASATKDKTLIFVSYNNLNLFETDKKLRIARSRKMLTLAPFLPEKTYLILSFCNLFLYLLEEKNFEQIYNIINKYKDEIFQKFQNYSQFTIRRFLHLYTILSFPFYLFENIEYLKTFQDNLDLIKEKMEGENNDSELKNLYEILKPLINFLILSLEKKNNTIDKIKTKDDNIFIDKPKNQLNMLFLTYSKDKNKILNTEFFYTLLGIYGNIFFKPEEFLGIISDIVKNFGKDTKVCNIDIKIFYRLKTNKKYSDIVLLRYIELYFKVFDIDPWSSSGIYFKSYIILFYLKLLKNIDNIEKYNNYKNIFINYLGSLSNFLNSKKLFFPEIFSEFHEILSSIYINKEENISTSTESGRKGIIIDYNFNKFYFSEKFIRLPKDEYDKDFYKILLQELTRIFNFDRGLLYLHNDKEIKLTEKVYREPILYDYTEAPYPFIKDDEVLPRFTIYKKIKNSIFSEMLYLPIFFVNALPRIYAFEEYNAKSFEYDKSYNNRHYNQTSFKIKDENKHKNEDKYKYRESKNFRYKYLRGYIYFDSKIERKRNIPQLTLNFTSFYISELFERIQIEKVYMHDNLTRVLTKENFYKNCFQILNMYRQSSINAFMMIDIDDFKKINDRFGHLKGDIVLSKVAQIIKNSLRSIDIVGRYGGEEFVVCLPNTSSENAYIVAERIRSNIENYNFLLPDYKVTVSIGLSFSPQDGLLAEELINKSDKAMYLSKNKGKNRVSIYSVDIISP